MADDPHPEDEAAMRNVDLALKYYANKENRQRWHLDFPDDPMPEHEPLPFDRDCHLPIRSIF